MSAVKFLSASQVDAFRMCPLKWHFRYVEKAEPESRSGALVVGSSVDTAIKAGLHEIRNGQVRLEEVNPEALFQAAWEAEVAAKDLPILWGAKGEESVRTTAQSLVTQYLSREDIQDLAERLELDVRFELPLVDEKFGIQLPQITLVGILDAVERLPDGRLRPLDWKTAASKQGYSPSALARHFQGSLYCWGLSKMDPERASSRLALHVGYKTAKSNWQEYEVDLGVDAQRRALRIVQAVHGTMLRGTPHPQPSFLCGACPYAKRCSRWDQEVTSAPLDIFATEVRSLTEIRS